MHRAVLLALTAVLAGAAPAPAAPAAVRELVLRGSRSAFVDITLPAATLPGQGDVATRTSGTFAGFYLAALPSGRVVTGGVQVRAFDADRTSVFSLRAPLPAGRYRVGFVTDGAAEVRVRLGGSGATLVPRLSAPLSAQAGAGDMSQVPAVPYGTARQAFRSPARTFAVVAAQVVGSSPVHHDYLSLCATKPGTGCEYGGKPWAYWTGGGSGSTTHSLTMTIVYAPGWERMLEPGTAYDAVQTYAGVEIPVRMTGFSLVAPV